MSIIEKLKLTEEDILYIIKEWYNNGMCEEVFQAEDGYEIDEWIDDRLKQYF